MKRFNNLHQKVCELENIELADCNARKNKIHRWGIIKHDRRRNLENQQLKELLETTTYKTSEYSTFKIYEPKERIIFRLPYYPDRIAHHAIMNITEPIWTKIFIKNTYSCIKNRGIHAVSNDLKYDLKEHPEDTKYCLKMDIRKFYPSINHEVLESIIKKKIKDKRLLTILHEIIYSSEGVPIGNYLSQYFANLYLAYFDHWIKEEVKIKFYYRYADDIVILHSDKNFLRNVLIAIKIYLKHILKLELKPNYQIFPVESRGIDFVGYRFYHTHTLLRKSIKNKIDRKVHEYINRKISKDEFNVSMRSYFGWLKYCNSKHLLHKIQRLTGVRFSNFIGNKVNISRFYNKKIYIVEVLSHNKYFEIHFTYNKKQYCAKSSDKQLFLYLCNGELPAVIKLKPHVYSKKDYNKSKASKDSVSE